VIVQRSAHDHPETMRRLTAPHASTLDAMAQLLSALARAASAPSMA
jgi:hypothetical protein